MDIDLSIIILSYKSKEHLQVLLPSVWASEGVGFELLPPASFEKRGSGTSYTAEVIIVDNDSRDGTAEWIEEQLISPSDIQQVSQSVSQPASSTADQSVSQSAKQPIRLIKNQNNGFAKGNNLGIRQSSGKYILLLNPDTKLEPDTLRLMLDLMESRADIGISGCKLIKADGTLDLACRRRFPNPWNSFARLFLKNNQNYNYSDLSENREMEVDSVVGAFLLIRREVMDKIGLLDETFFMYGEDLDWCWRCKEAGYKVWYYPKAVCRHYKGESSKKIPFRALKWFHDAMWIFYRKHYGERYPFFFNWLVWLGIYGRMAVLMVNNFFKKKRLVSK